LPDIYTLIDKTSKLGALTDYILIDLSASTSEVVGAALSQCDFVNLVVGSGPELLDRLESSIPLLSNLPGIDPKRLGLVIVDRVGIGLNTELSTLTSVRDIPVMGIIPYGARECTEAEGRGIPVVLSDPISPVAGALRRLSDRLLSLEQLAPSSDAG